MEAEFCGVTIFDILSRMRAQFTLANLILAVLGIGFVLGLMTRPATYLGSVSVTLAAGFLLAAVLQAVFRRGEDREFWIGFAIVGWGYFVLAFAEPFREEVGTHLLTTRLLEWLRDDPRFQPIARTKDYWEFLRYGQSMMTMFLALAGGAATRFYFATRRRPNES